MLLAKLKQRADLTHKFNTGSGRHGWLRLTPAYSRKIVEQILDDAAGSDVVFDPFSGSGTTPLCAAFRGMQATAAELNPFLVWLARAKLAHYSEAELNLAQKLADHIVRSSSLRNSVLASTPPIHRIDRWWSPTTLHQLRLLKGAIDQAVESESVRNLLLVSFCRTLIHVSNAAFNHQSMSFKLERSQRDLLGEDRSVVLEAFRRDSAETIRSARLNPITIGSVIQADARTVGDRLEVAEFDLVITSPPYPNRMSYIRELRPYMYWLGYLTNSREAGELDWEAIGGTWGCATSRLTEWSRPKDAIVLPQLEEVLALVRSEHNKNGSLLANYIDRYFVDMFEHLNRLTNVLKSGATVHYVVGNSTFYGVLLPVEELFAEMFRRLRFADVSVHALRKRNSKKELIEFDVVARWP